MNTKVLTIFTEKFKSHRPCFTFKASKTDFHHLPGIYREQLVWLFVIQLFCLLWRQMGNHFAHNLHKFGFAYSEELEVNQWIALDILSSQSECVKDTIHCLVLNLYMFYCRWGQTMRDWWHLKVTPAARRNRKIVHWNWSPQQGGNREVKKKLHVQFLTEWVAMLNSHKYAIMKKQIMKSTLCTWGVCL